MTQKWVWDTLGLERTRDVKAIRRAYAARLKADHPEDNGEAFMRLREAHDMALAWAGARRHEAAPFLTVPVDEADASGDPEATDADETPEAPRRRIVTLDAAPDEEPAPNTRRRISPSTESEAEADREAAPDPPQAVKFRALKSALERRAHPETLLALFGDLVNGPEMEDVGVAIETERNLTHLVASHLPAANALVAPVIQRFGWSMKALPGQDTEAVAFLLRHAGELEIMALMTRLEASLGDPDGGDRVSQALADILHHRALDDLNVHAAVERWLAELIVQRAPQADGLVQAAAWRFKWQPLASNPPLIQAALAREPRRRAIESRGQVSRIKGGSGDWTWIARFAFPAAIVILALLRTLGSSGTDDYARQYSSSPPIFLAAPPERGTPPPSAPSSFSVASKGVAKIDCVLLPTGSLSKCKVLKVDSNVENFGSYALKQVTDVKFLASSSHSKHSPHVQIGVRFDGSQNYPLQIDLPNSVR